MPDRDLKPVFAFVWRPREMTKQVMDMARHTGTSAIFDDEGNVGSKQFIR